MNIITGFQVAALVAIIVALAIVLHMLEARRRINAMPMPKDENEQAKEDEKLHRRMLHEADAYNQACNMEPFCGEGKRLTEKEKREELERLNLCQMSNVPEHLRPDPYKTSYDPQYWKTLFGEGKKP